MNPMIKQLIRKDWQINRNIMAIYIGVMLIANVMLLADPNNIVFGMGLILILTILFIMCIHLTTSNVISEYSQKTVTFIMSLPVSARQYAIAKLAANLSMFCVPWLMALVSSWLIILSSDSLPNGLTALATLGLVEILLSYCLIMMMGIVTESQHGAIGAMAIANLGFQAFLWGMLKIPAIAQHRDSNELAWNSTELSILAIQLVVIIGLLGTTLLIQQRKTNFI
ncbi:ABC-2 transporter permease [Herpetosiphon llansteffanensis]|uniref:ABC-2 transporter permease n=1 Tax=Herpetosiphon llansteffanensis TaxID=2094568 RepID=UPI000D7C6FDB|nr:ABC-2 transporter permease [Herpetosiphon llansteffanensis]